MGVLNVTPDSFSDGGRFLDPAAAAARGRAMIDEGADLLDVGGESSRPGAVPVDPAEEEARVVPVIRALRAGSGVPISVDTRRASVARAALEAGADIVNDISALGDRAMAAVVRASGAGLVLMHMRGEPATMQAAPAYEDVVSEVSAFLSRRLEAAGAAGIPPGAVVLDPGIGFGKTLDHNLALLADLGRIAAAGRPVLVGVSRKSVVGALTGRAVGERLAGSLALAAYLALRGAAVLRVHDVKETCDAVRIVDRMRNEESEHGLELD
jgi:dihydropteroate synthase